MLDHASALVFHRLRCLANLIGGPVTERRKELGHCCRVEPDGPSKFFAVRFGEEIPGHQRGCPASRVDVGGSWPGRSVPLADDIGNVLSERCGFAERVAEYVAPHEKVSAGTKGPAYFGEDDGEVHPVDGCRCDRNVESCIGNGNLLRGCCEKADLRETLVQVPTELNTGLNSGTVHPLREESARRLAASGPQVEGMAARNKKAQVTQSLPQFLRVGRTGVIVECGVVLEVRRVRRRHHLSIVAVPLATKR